VHGLAGVRQIWRYNLMGLTARSSGARGRYEEPILGVFGSRRHWKGEVGGGFERNNDGEGTQGLFIGAGNGAGA
jgi:hypothetical protein